MMVRRRRFFSFSAALLLAALPASAEDLTVVSKVTFGDREDTQTQYMTSERSRSSDKRADVIIHFPTGALTFIDHEKKEYYETTIEEMASFMDRMVREMKGTPAEAMFGLSGEAEVEKLPGKQKIAGYDCERYSISIGDALELDLWTAPGLKPPPRYFDGRKLAYAAMGPMGKLYERMFNEMKKIGGYPLSTAVILRTPVSRTQTLTEAVQVKKGPIPASTFDLPSGYRKKKSPYAR